jgi:hypothetical protein
MQVLNLHVENLPWMIHNLTMENAEHHLIEK